MTRGGYERVIPRDLFNEADLLKCWGKLWIALDDRRDHFASIPDHSGEPFDIVQDPSSGALTVANLSLIVHGQRRAVYRPLNSREPWPLWVWSDDDDIRVFDLDGNLSPEFWIFITETQA